MLFYWYFKEIAVFEVQQTADLQLEMFEKIYGLRYKLT